MALTRATQDSFTALNLLIDLKKLISGIKDMEALQQTYQSLKEQSDDVDKKILANSDLLVKQKKQLDDMEIANTILNEKQAAINSSSADLEKRKSYLESIEREQKELAEKQSAQQAKIDADRADLDKKIAKFNQDKAELDADKKEVEEYKGVLRQRADTIKAQMEGL